MAKLGMNDYERQRLENIRKNNEMMAALKLHAAASALSSTDTGKRRWPSTTPIKSYKSKKIKPDPENLEKNSASLRRQSLRTRGFPPTVNSDSAPIVLRRSLRTRGLPPTQSSDSTSHSPSKSSPSLSSPRYGRDPFPLQQVFVSKSGPSDRGLVDTIRSAAGVLKRDPDGHSWQEFGDPREMMELKEGNVARLVPERILTVLFFPFVDRTLVVAGDKAGHLGFWDAGASGSGDSDRVYLYSPHSAPISGIIVHPFSATKIYTSSYDGFLRMMDFERETFDMIYCSNYPIYSVCQRLNDSDILYFGEGSGDIKVWDRRMAKAVCSWELHEQRINTVDFNTRNPTLMATSSTDGMACVWDLRSIKQDRPESLKMIKHNRVVHSAYFSPSGHLLATTSLDDSVGIHGGANYDDQFMVSHNNQTGRWLSNFRAIWGWDDSYLYLGNMRRGIDIISTKDKTTTCLTSDDMTSIPCRFAAHSQTKGSLACSTSGGKVFLWTTG